MDFEFLEELNEVPENEVDVSTLYTFNMKEGEVEAILEL